MSKFKIGDRVKVIKLGPGMPGNGFVEGTTYIVDNYTSYPNHCIKLKNLTGSYPEEFFELENIMKRGLFFKKDNELFIIGESVNQRWLVSLSTGIIKHVTPSNVNTSTSDLEAKGYTLVDVPKDVFNVIARINT